MLTHKNEINKKNIINISFRDGDKASSYVSILVRPHFEKSSNIHTHTRLK